MKKEKFESDLDAAAAQLLEKAVNETPAQMLEKLVELSMRRAKDILNNEAMDAGLIRTQAALINTFMTSAIRVQENMLRQRKMDAIERVTKLVEEERARQQRLGY